MKTEPPSRTTSRRNEGDLRINWLNRQRKVPVPKTAIEKTLHGAARSLDVSGEIALLFTTDKTIHRMNRDFRGKDKPTDVLSFEGPGGDMGLGDIVISVETASQNARRDSRTVGTELQILALHGFLHALGYDHEKDSGEMEKLERKLRRQFGLSTAAPPSRT